MNTKLTFEIETSPLSTHGTYFHAYLGEQKVATASIEDIAATDSKYRQLLFFPNVVANEALERYFSWLIE